MVFYKLKNFSLSPGIEPDSLSPESPSSTTRPYSHNSTSDYVVYINAFMKFSVSLQRKKYTCKFILRLRKCGILRSHECGIIFTRFLTFIWWRKKQVCTLSYIYLMEKNRYVKNFFPV